MGPVPIHSCDAELSCCGEGEGSRDRFIRGPHDGPASADHLPPKHPHQRPRRRVHLLPRPHEVRRVAPVGVGDGLAGHAGDDVQQQGELGGGVWWGEGLQVGEVLGVEGEDVGEAREVGGGDLAGAVRGDVEAVAGGFGDRAGVGRAADVPVAGAGGVGMVG